MSDLDKVFMHRYNAFDDYFHCNLFYSFPFEKIFKIKAFLH